MECDILDFSEYGNEPDIKSDALLKAALEGLGAKVRVRRLTREGVTTALSKRVWLRYDLRSFRDLFFVINIARTLGEAGHLVFPAAQSIRRSEDKWESYLALGTHGVPTVETYPLGGIGACGPRAVIKPRVGWGGMGMRIVTPEAPGSEPVPGDGRSYVWQPFVEHGHTWTAAIAGDREATLLQKRSRTGDFRTNSEFGEEAVLAGDPGGLSALAQRAVRAFGLVAGTADIMEVAGRMVVLEVNSAPCLWYDELPDLDLAGPMARAVMEWFERGAP